jgi:HK97 family phage portal protein
MSRRRRRQQRAREPAILNVSSSNPSVFWPTGNGDRGPPGSWQRNLYEHNPASLLAFSAVYACTSMISGDVAKLPLIINRIDLDTGAREPLRSDYYVSLFRSPNDYQTRTDFLQLFILSYLLQGNGYAYCTRNLRGEVSAMHVLDPRTTIPYIGQDTGEVFYRVGANMLAGLKGGEVIPARNIIHHRLPLLPSFPLIGVTPIFAAAASSAVGISILSNSQKFFGNASRPSGVLTAPGRVSEPTQERLRNDWDNNYSGANFGKTAVLPEGLKWEPLTITAQDSQLIEQLRWSVEDVGRVFRVPSFMLGDTSKVTYRNSEQLARAYLNGCLAYHIETLEKRFEFAFDFPIDYEIKFDLSQFLRTEIDVRYTAYQQALNGGWLSINEVRGSEGLEPVKGGEVPRVQVQYVPIDVATSIQGPPAQVPGPGPGEPTPPAPSEPDATSAETTFDAALVRAALRRRFPS